MPATVAPSGTMLSRGRQANGPIVQFSPMLLSRLSKDEILDLAAYVLSSGNREHAMFKK